MKEIAKRVWSEPAVAIGLAASLLLLVLQLLDDNNFTADTIISIAAPFLSALGIRQVVTPAIQQTNEGSSMTTETPPPADPQPGQLPPDAPGQPTEPTPNDPVRPPDVPAQPGQPAQPVEPPTQPADPPGDVADAPAPPYDEPAGTSPYDA